MTTTESPNPGRYSMVMYNLKVYEYLTKMECNMTLDRFVESMEIPRDFLPNGYCGPTAKFLTEMSWVDQVVHFISFGYGRYHETEAPLQFIEQPNGDPHIVLIKTMVKPIYHPEKNSMMWCVCGNVYECYTPSFREVRMFLDQAVLHFRKKLHEFDPNTYTVTDDKLTDFEKQTVLEKLSKRRGLTRQFSFLWL